MTRPRINLIPRFRVFSDSDPQLGISATSIGVLWLGIGVDLTIARRAA